MAKYIGSLTSDARGKVGGFIMTRGSNGTNLKAHAVPVQPRSSFQQANRNIIAAANFMWRNIPSMNRSGWGALAPQYVWVNSLAQSYSPTPLQLFTQVYFNARQFGTVTTGIPPAFKPVITPITDASIVTAGYVLTIKTYTSGIDYAGYWFCSCSPQINPTITYTNGLRRRPMGYSPGPATIDASAAWLTAWGNPPLSGSSVSLRCVPVDPDSFISGVPIIVNLTIG